MIYNRKGIYMTIIFILCAQIVFIYGAKRTTKKCECGKIAQPLKIAPRIVGGDLTKAHKYPWMALILYMNIAVCGGSIINNYYILTAAHCVQPYRHKMDKMGVILGVHDRIQMNEGTEKFYKVAKEILHPGHIDHNQFDENDIALVKVDREIKYNDYIKPVCLPNRGDNFVHKAAIVSGWGRKLDEGFSSRYLHEVTLEILTGKQCTMSKIGNLYRKIPDQLLCAYQRNTDSCQGDSGGPLVTKLSDDSMVLIGLVSFGKVCGGLSSPGAYTKVTHYLDWIEDSTKDAIYCRGFTDTEEYKRLGQRNPRNNRNPRINSNSRLIRNQNYRKTNGIQGDKNKKKNNRRNRKKENSKNKNNKKKNNKKYNRKNNKKYKNNKKQV